MPKPSTANNEQFDRGALPVWPAPFESPRLLTSWQAPARVFALKTDAYFATLAILSLVLALLIFFALNDAILALLILSLGLAIYAVNRVEPPLADYGIYTTHLALDEKKYFYKDLRWFWVSEENGQKLIHISTDLSLPPRLLLVAPPEILPEAQEALLKYLPYHEEKEPAVLKYIDQFLTYLAARLPDSVVSFFKRVESQAPRVLRRS